MRTTITNLTPEDALRVLRAMDTGGFEVNRVEPSGMLTDEANAERSWQVKRTRPPFCDARGTRAWDGPTPISALDCAELALRIKVRNERS